MARLRIETSPEITVFDESAVFKAASGATASLVEFKNSAGTVVANVAANGSVAVSDLTVTGNLTVSGTTTTINTETLTIDDNIIVLNNNATGAASQNAGIEVERGSDANVLLRWNETDNAWELTNDGSTYSAIATASSVSSATTLSVDNLSDTTISNAAAGQFLKWNGSAWVNDAVPIISNIDDITGVTITSVANGQLLQYNGSAWVNATVSTTPTWEDENNILASTVFS